MGDDTLTHFAEVHGDAPTPAWLAAFTKATRSGTDPANDTTGSGVFIQPVPGSGLTVCGGRPTAIRRRERHEITMLTVVARYIRALLGRGLDGR